MRQDAGLRQSEQAGAKGLRQLTEQAKMTGTQAGVGGQTQAHGTGGAPRRDGVQEGGRIGSWVGRKGGGAGQMGGERALQQTCWGRKGAGGGDAGSSEGRQRRARRIQAGRDRRVPREEIKQIGLGIEKGQNAPHNARRQLQRPEGSVQLRPDGEPLHASHTQRKGAQALGRVWQQAPHDLAGLLI